MFIHSGSNQSIEEGNCAVSYIGGGLPLHWCSIRKIFDLTADAAAVIATLGLGTAATTAATAYATAAQGTLAASATQPGDLATVATSGDYDDLSNKPTLGTAAATASTAYATAAQGTKADANDTDIDDIYTQLDTIGNNAAITTVAELKAALLAMVRS